MGELPSKYKYLPVVEPDASLVPPVDDDGVPPASKFHLFDVLVDVDIVLFQFDDGYDNDVVKLVFLAHNPESGAKSVIVPFISIDISSNCGSFLQKLPVLYAYTI